MFRQNVVSHVNIIQCPPTIDEAAVQEFSSLILGWVGSSEKLHLLDFRGVSRVPQAFYTQMASFQQHLNKKGALVVSLHLSADILDRLQKDGMEKVFHPIKDIKEALKRLGLMNATQSQQAISHISTDFLAPLVSAVLFTVSTVANVKVALAGNKPVDTKTNLKIDMATTVDIENQVIQGTLALYMPNDLVKALCLKTFQSSDFDLLKDGQDLNREILNIASGKAKTEWVEKFGYAIKRGAIQTVNPDQLPQHRESFLKEAVVLPFETQFGLFYLGVRISNKQGNAVLSFQSG